MEKNCGDTPSATLNLIVPLKGLTSFQMEIIMKYQKYIDEIKKSPPPELLGQFYNIHLYNHTFAQLYWLISGE